MLSELHESLLACVWEELDLASRLALLGTCRALRTRLKQPQYWQTLCYAPTAEALIQGISYSRGTATVLNLSL